MLSRRTFLDQGARAASGVAIGTQLLPGERLAAEDSSSTFASRWHDTPDRVWAGPEYWANPLQDWCIRGGRLELVRPVPDRNVHLLTRAIGARPGNFEARVRIGRVAGGALAGNGKGSVGFRIGIRGPLPDYRNALTFGEGLDAGLTAEGGLFLGSPSSAKPGSVKLTAPSIELRLTAKLVGDDYRLSLSAHDVTSGDVLGQIAREKVAPQDLTGGLALVANYAVPGPAAGRGPRAAATPAAGVDQYWFADWRLSGNRIENHDDRSFGPILFTQYTLHEGLLKLTAQMPPLGKQDDSQVRLEVRRGDAWQSVGQQEIHAESRTATFRAEKWDATADADYRVAYKLRTTAGVETEHYFHGTIRRDPVDQAVLTVADISCNAHFAFPNAECAARMKQLDPDLLAFTGDQYYEVTGGYGVQRGALDVALLDMLRKWYMHGWTWRELMRDRPSVSIPDDHDVYHGNLWGEAGAGVEQGRTNERGGYSMPVAFVNAVHRTQTAHHPDAFDPAPGKRGTSVYFGPLTYGRVSFAILADRQFKSGPEGKVPPTGGRADHVKDPNFDPRTADLPGLELLGERQMKFLRHWAGDWRGADMKAVISQTIFTAMATTHGGNRERLTADYDANGWPQTARNAALAEMRRCFAFHLAGDQHLPAVIHYGIDQQGDAAAAFAGPAVNNLYPRWFEPQQPGEAGTGAQKYTGDFRDSFGHPLRVLAVANPKLTLGKRVLEAETDKMAGFGVVRFNKKSRTITVECWPLLGDPQAARSQFDGWPVTIEQLQNCGLPGKALLPKLLIRGTDRPVVEVVDQQSGRTVYSLRAPQPDWQPPVFAPGRYIVRISEPESGRSTELRDVEAKPDNRGVLEVNV